MNETKAITENVQLNPPSFPLLYEKKFSKKGSIYHCLSVDLGYRKVPLTFSREILVEILDVPFSELNSYPIDTVKKVGDVFHAK